MLIQHLMYVNEERYLYVDVSLSFETSKSILINLNLLNYLSDRYQFYSRLLAQNGDFVKVATEWSSFINPWSRKLEFVTAKHHILEVLMLSILFF